MSNQVEAAASDASGGPILSPRRVGDVNRSRILQTLVDNGPLSRAELSRLANVTRATISNIVNSLMASLQGAAALVLSGRFQLAV